MKILKGLIVSFALLFAFQLPANAQHPDAKIAVNAAEGILKNFAVNQYKQVWSQQTSKFFKDRMKESEFITGISFQRSSLGTLNSHKIEDVKYFSRDPSSGFQGDIFAVMFRTNYNAGEFLEQIVVVKDADGTYRMSGFHGVPAPKP